MTTDKDVEYLSEVLAKGISGLIQIGISDGLKMNAALKAVASKKASQQLAAGVWTKFFEVNPQASAAIELAAATSPGLAAMLERIKVKKPEIKDAEDVRVR